MSNIQVHLTANGKLHTRTSEREYAFVVVAEDSDGYCVSWHTSHAAAEAQQKKLIGRGWSPVNIEEKNNGVLP